MANNATVLVHDRVNFPHLSVNDICMYMVSSSNLVINAGIVLMFVVQRWRRPSDCRLNPAGAFVINLLIADALVGAMGIYITASFNLTPGIYGRKPFGCVNRMTPRFFFRMGSHMALINVAIDRYIAIMHTLHYRDIMTKKRCLVLIGIGWLVPSLGTAYAYLGNNWTPPGHNYCYQVPFFSVFLAYIRLPCHIAALIFVIFIQCRIFIFLRRHEKNETAQSCLRQYSRKSARILFLVTTTYVVCWLPYDIMTLLVLLYFRPRFLSILGSAVVLAYSSFLVNAFIFSSQTENIRKPVSDLWRDLVNAASRDKKRAAKEDLKQVNAVAGRGKRDSVLSSSSNITASAFSHDDGPKDVTLHI